MKGARRTLAAAVLVGVTAPLCASPAAAAPPPDVLQKRLDGLQDTVDGLDQRLAAEEKALVAAQSAAFSAAAQADLRKAAHDALVAEVAAAPQPVNLLQAAFLRITGSPTDELEQRRDAAGNVAARAAADAETARLAFQDAVDRVGHTRDLRARTTAQVRDVKDDLRDAYTYQGVTIWGSGTAAVATRAALDQLGDPYVWAAAGPDSFDCSGLVIWAWAQAGRPGLPHYTGALYDLGTKIARSALKPGDLVFFNSGRSHMGIYVGQGRFVHAPSSGDVVKITQLTDRRDYSGAVRL
ncbi:C40 family peptidase [Actinocorallia sp. API 0066]|uniref:C40 family peptidase n=1 Tax=Actinocorallia sp. API 0066 TaxID=2896846 RepID=UPI001E41D7F6|nr:C40 family peptidase [Actinocorallia sp. API 0066]MCD0447921.1 C40 family peptidase [Actinocorallia sp. API 0066]